MKEPILTRWRKRLSALAPLPLKVFAYRLFFAARLRRQTLARRMLPIKRYAARRVGLTIRPHGINLIANVRSIMSGGVIARGMAQALESTGIPFNIVPTSLGPPSRNRDSSLIHREVSRSRYDISIICENPDGFTSLRRNLPASVLGGSYVIAYSFWELPEFPEGWMHVFDSINEYWAGSRFIQEAVALKSPVPVVRIPPVVQLDSAQHFPRTHFGLPESRFLFLTMADTGSVLERKNPLGVVRAFKKAFPASDSSVGLVIKLYNPECKTSLSWQTLLDEISECENIYVVDRGLTREEMSSLISHGDCYVSLHRSEGFGLGPAEAMSLGRPVIATNWSGTTDYMTSQNSLGVDYELVRLGSDFGNYKAFQFWAEPDIEQAAHWMNRVAREPELAGRIGMRGKQTISSEFSAEAVGNLIRTRLEYIRRRS